MYSKVSKKWLSVMLLSILLFVTACSGQPATNNQAANASNNNAANDQQASENTDNDPVGKYDPAITVTMGRDQLTNTTFPEGDSLDDNIWTRALLDEYGVKIENLWVTDSSQYWEKLNLSITSGDIPDIFQVRGTTLKELTETGMIADLTEVFEKHASPLLKEKLNEDGGIGLESATIDGKLMGLPYVTAAIDSAPMIWIRKDWLNNLGIPEPESLDDVIEIARAFTYDDPDQNGVNDTIGLGLTKNIFGAGGGLMGFFNGYHANTNVWVEDGNGGLANGLIQPEMRAALVKLQEMYAEGIIDTEFSAKSGIGDDVIAGKIGMFYGTMSQPLNPLTQSMERDPNADWHYYPILSIDGEPARPQVSYNPPVYFVTSADNEHPAAIVKMMNLFAEKFFGETADPLFNYDEDGHHSHKYQVVRTYGAKKNLNNHLMIKEALETGSTDKLNPEQMEHYDQMIAYEAGDHSHWKYVKIFGPEGSLSLINDYVENDLIYSDQYIGLPTDTMVNRGSVLSDLALTTFTNIIMGDPIERFDAFVEEWKALGGDKMTAEVNEWLQDRQ